MTSRRHAHLNEPVADAETGTTIVMDDDEAFCEECLDIVTDLGQTGRITCDLPTDTDLAACCRVILDLGLGDFTGFDVLTRLAAHKPDIPILLVSGHGRDLLRSAVEFGRDLGLRWVSALEKPLDSARLREWLGRRVPLPTSGSCRSAAAISLSPGEVAQLVDQGGLRIHVQPQFDLNDGNLFGFEALARLQHPRLGLLGPASFLDGLFEAELDDILFSVLLDACERLSDDLAGRHGRHFHVSVNLSSRLLTSQEDQLLARLGQCRLDPSRLTLEITESIAPGAAHTLTPILARLRLKGHGLALDDFGTAHSNFDRVLCLPLTEVKVDRLFLDQIAAGSVSPAVVRQIHSICATLGLRTVVEGIGSTDLLRWAAQTEADVGQGFLFSPPLPVEGLRRTLGSICNAAALEIARIRRGRRLRSPSAS